MWWLSNRLAGFGTPEGLDLSEVKEAVAPAASSELQLSTNSFPVRSPPPPAHSSCYSLESDNKSIERRLLEEMLSFVPLLSVLSNKSLCELEFRLRDYSKLTVLINPV